MPRVLVAIVASLLVAFCLIASLLRRSDGLHVAPNLRETDSAASAEIQVFVAASNRAVIEEISRNYTRETGQRVVLQFGASQTLLTQMEIGRSGDLFLPADDSYLDVANEKGLIDDIFPIATMRIGLAVKKGNPRDIRGLDSLLQPSSLSRPGVRLVQATPDAAAIGKLTREVLLPLGRWPDIERCTMAFRANVNEVANDIRLGVADTGFIYDAMLSTYPDLEWIELPEFRETVSHVSIGVIRKTASRDAAHRFIRYVTSPESGLKVYRRYGFDVTRNIIRLERERSGDSDSQR